MLLTALGAAVVGLCCYGGAFAAVVAVVHRPAATQLAAPPMPTDRPESVGSWYTGGAKDIIDAVTADSRAVTLAVRDHDLAAVRTACLALQGHLDRARAYRPMPDAVAQSAWAQALTEYDQGASDCAAAAAGNDPGLLRRANDEILAGVRAQDRATAAAARR